MKTINLSVLILYAFISSCKKEYACKCTNPGGTETAFITTATKAKAKKQCDDYYKDHFGSMPFSETSCGIK